MVVVIIIGVATVAIVGSGGGSHAGENRTIQSPGGANENLSLTVISSRKRCYPSAATLAASTVQATSAPVSNGISLTTGTSPD